MAAPNEIIIAFDLYGTLLSTSSISKALASLTNPEKADEIATLWRRYQLEYTWRLVCMNQYRPFDDVTRRALRHALAETATRLDSDAIDSLMHAYDSLATFPDVAPALTALNAQPHVAAAVVFSNGTDGMVSNSVRRSPDLAPHAAVFRELVTVEAVRTFKPSPEVYFHLADRMGKGRGAMGDLWLVSGNMFDVVGARSVGMRAAWVDREGKGWTDALIEMPGLPEGDDGGPTLSGRGLGEIVEKILHFGG